MHPLKVMPILTTTYPLMNSTFNVSQHTLKLIQEKMLVAAEICDRILEGHDHWETLFKVSKKRPGRPPARLEATPTIGHLTNFASSLIFPRPYGKEY